MDFATKLAQTRAYTTENQNGVDAQEVYDEAILQAIELTNPINPFQVVECENRNAGVFIYDEIYSSISFSFSSDFTGTFQNTTIQPNTIINLTAKTFFASINLEVITGSVFVIFIRN